MRCSKIHCPAYLDIATYWKMSKGILQKQHWVYDMVTIIIMDDQAAINILSQCTYMRYYSHTREC